MQSEERKFFYNPMWSRFGARNNGPPGTYYRRGSAQVEYFWNVFDQVLVRPDLLEDFREEELKVLTKIGSVSLISDAMVPDRSIASDHLPLVFELNISI